MVEAKALGAVTSELLQQIEDAAHEHFAISESLVLKIEAPDAICIISNESRRAGKQRG